MNHNVWLGIWEIAVLVTTVVVVIRMVGSPKRRVRLAAFPVLYLMTQLLWSPLSGGSDLNNAGSVWWLDPWNHFFSLGPPAFKWWVWLLFVVAIVLTLTMRTQVLPRLVICLLLILGLLGVDGLLSFGATDPWSHISARRSSEVANEDKSCSDLLSDTMAASKASDVANTEQSRIPDGDLRGDFEERKVYVRNDTLVGLQDLLQDKRSECLLGHKPVARLTATLQKDGRTVKFNASASKGDGLTYELLPDDLNHGDPLTPRRNTFTFSYSEPGLHQPKIVLTDVYGSHAEASRAVTTHGRAR